MNPITDTTTRIQTYSFFLYCFVMIRIIVTPLSFIPCIARASHSLILACRHQSLASPSLYSALNRGTLCLLLCYRRHTTVDSETSVRYRNSHSFHALSTDQRWSGGSPLNSPSISLLFHSLFQRATSARHHRERREPVACLESLLARNTHHNSTQLFKLSHIG
jgi:hypothetical protein